MQAQLFHIKVALLGHVSVGKTTILNALFQDKFSEVSMRRTTAGINHFRVSTETPSAESSYQPSAHYDYDIKSSQQTLSEITKDNSILREQNIIKETIFDIKLDKHLFEMRGDTCLCIVDIPGINEAHSSTKYVEYVKKSWETFDCVVVVMDAVQGVNTEEQVQLLQYVKKFQMSIRKQPVIVLCNKFDDPYNKELQVLVNEVQAEVEKVFQVPSRTSALQRVLSDIEKCKRYDKDAMHVASPAFIPISAKNAFLYRSASRLSFDEFKHFNKDLVDEIGREEFGRFKWKKLSSIQQYEQVYKIVSDPDEYKERLAESNFDKFIGILGYFVGGGENQADLIYAQMEIALNKINSSLNISDKLSDIYNKCKILNKSINQVQDRFWDLYEECEENAIECLTKDPFCIKDLYRPMKELIQYESKLHRMIYELGTDMTNEERIKDEGRIIESMKDLVRRVCNVAIVKINEDSSWKLDLWTWDGSRWNNDDDYDDGSSDESRHPDGNLAIHWRWDETNKVWVHVITGCKRNKKENPAIAEWQWVYNRGWYNKYYGSWDFDESRHPAGDLESHWKWNASTNKWVHTITDFEKEGVENRNPAMITNWYDLSPYDEQVVLTSILSLKYNKYFSKYFGAEIAQLVWINKKPVDRWQWHKLNEYLKGEIKNGKFEPSNPVMYKRIVNIEPSTSIESQDHWGHVGWMFCEFMKAREMATRRVVVGRSVA